MFSVITVHQAILVPGNPVKCRSNTLHTKIPNGMHSELKTGRKYLRPKTIAKKAQEVPKNLDDPSRVWLFISNMKIQVYRKLLVKFFWWTFEVLKSSSCWGSSGSLPESSTDNKVDHRFDKQKFSLLLRCGFVRNGWQPVFRFSLKTIYYSSLWRVSCFILVKNWLSSCVKSSGWTVGR